MSVKEADIRLWLVVDFDVRREDSVTHTTGVLIEAINRSNVDRVRVVTRVPSSYVRVSSMEIAEDGVDSFSRHLVESCVFVLFAFVRVRYSRESPTLKNASGYSIEKRVRSLERTLPDWLRRRRCW